VFGTRQTRSGQEQYAWSQPTTLRVSQERPARAGVYWQELAPPGGELTSPAEEDACHKVAPRASTHGLSVRPPAPVLPSSMGLRCYNLAIQKGPGLACLLHASGSPFHGVVLRGTLLMRQERLAVQCKRESMDTIMVAQENVALARSLFDLYNNRQSDPAWLAKSIALFAVNAEIIDVPTGATFHGPEGYMRLGLFSIENFPDMRVELTNAFATEDQVTLECTWRWNDTGPLPLPLGALPLMGRSGELRICFVLQIRKGKIASLHQYYDMMTQMEQLGLVPVTGTG